MSEGPRVGLLTGTFDPVHLGHVALAEAAAREFELDRVLLWVNAGAPHKVGVTPYLHRLAMAKLATAGSNRLGVYEGKLSRESHTIKTFVGLADEFSGQRLGYIVGADTIAMLDRWDDVQSVVENTTFMAAERGSKEARVVVHELRRRLGSLGDRLKVEVFELDDYAGVSSAQARDQVRAGERPEALGERVYEYILSHNLYR